MKIEQHTKYKRSLCSDKAQSAERTVYTLYNLFAIIVLERNALYVPQHNASQKC